MTDPATPKPSELVERDRRHSWHPYTQHALERDPLPVASAHGATLVLEDGREVLDAISSWWSVLHGHGDAELADTLAEQTRTLDHVLFAGTTHEPAVALAEELVACTPGALSRVFYSDNGSTAVEVALKMVYQAWVHAGEPERRTFLALDGSYHGDTFGAMSIGDPDPFFVPYAPLLFKAERFAPALGRVGPALERLGKEAAGVIVEPLVQGAAGMKMHRPEFLQEVRAACDAAGVPLIADEVMTGFGRTGSLFACEKAGIEPDLLCLAKGLTAGLLPLSATLATERLYESFLSDDRGRAFFHGHTFTANPIGCALARASLAKVFAEKTPDRLEAIGAAIHARVAPALEELDWVSGLRRTGGIVAFDLEPPKGEKAGYLASLAPRLRALAIEHGVLLRPLGNVVYALPPACTTQAECERIAAVMVVLAEAARPS